MAFSDLRCYNYKKVEHKLLTYRYGMERYGFLLQRKRTTKNES